MRIGIISYDLSILAGGTQLSLTLGNELQKEGYEVAYACVYEDMKMLSKKFDFKFDFKIYRKKKPIFGRVFVNYNSMLNHSFPIYKMCKDFKPDVIIETGDFPGSLVIPVMLKIPSIHYAIETSYSYEINLLNKFYFMPIKPIEKMIAKKVNVYVISDYAVEIAKKIWSVNATVICPPVNTDVFIPSEKKENIILCVLRFLPPYKFEYMINAFRRLERDDYSLIIIGGLDPENEESFGLLKKYIKNDNNIKLIPNADFELLLEYYKKSKFFWYLYAPYLYSIAIAEGQSVGLPTICFGEGDKPKDIVINRETGYLVKNFDEMIERTRLLIDDESLWEKMSKAARENAVKRLGLDVFMNKFRAAIEEVRNAQ